MMTKISIFGLGYVGLANALLLGQHEEVMAYDIVDKKINLLNKQISPLEDIEIIDFLSNGKSKVEFTTDFEKAVNHADYLIIATPTDYDEKKNFFDVSTVENVIERALTVKPSATFIIKSTIPVGYTDSVKKKFGIENIIFFVVVM